MALPHIENLQRARVKQMFFSVPLLVVVEIFERIQPEETLSLAAR
jgi:hypothetical protein